MCIYTHTPTNAHTEAFFTRKFNYYKKNAQSHRNLNLNLILTLALKPGLNSKTAAFA